MFSLTYVSSASRLLTSNDLLNLVSRCVDNNRALNVTGLLLHREGNFMQVLEGEDEAVTRILSAITRDDRHRGLITLIRDPVSDRQFPGWPLGFVDCTLRSPLDLPHIAANVESFFGIAFKDNPSKAQKLLLSFARS